MSTAIEIKVGSVLNLNGRMYKVLKTDHVKPGKGGAFMQTEMKDIETGSKLYERFRSSESVEFVHVEARKATYMYDGGSGEIEFMYSDTFEQFSIPYDIIGDARHFLTEALVVEIEIANEKPINVRLPQRVEAVIKETQSYVKGQTVSNSFKPAILENGHRIMVPQFIESGERVLINTDTLEYSERVK